MGVEQPNISPQARVFNADRSTEISAKVERFKYVSDEQADDICEITLSSGDPNLPDDPDLQESKALIVAWGYVNGRISDKRKVYIQDVLATFSEEGVRLILNCSDKYSTVKYNSSQKTKGATTIVEELADIAQDNGLEMEVDDGTNEPRLVIGVNQPVRLQGGQILAAIDNARVFREFPGVAYANRSNAQVVNEMARQEPGGPWYVDGTDDKVTLKKRNFNKTPLRAYTYKGEDGTLISFTPETKSKTQGGGNINLNIGGWDVEQGKYLNSVLSSAALNTNSFDFGGMVNQVHNPEVAGVDLTNKVRIGNTGILGDNIKQSPSSPRPSIVIGNTTGQVGEEGTEFLNSIEGTDFVNADGSRNVLPGGYVFDKVEEWGQNKPQTTQGGQIISAIDNARVVGGAIWFKPVEDVPKEDLIVGPDLADSLAEGPNMLQKNQEETNPATLVVVGNPDILKGTILTLLNVSKKYSGNYYVTKAEHEPYFSTGYLTTCELVRTTANNLNIPGSNDISLVDAVRTVENKGHTVKTPPKQNKEVGPGGEGDLEQLLYLNSVTPDES